jgi:hypothetical protein
VAEKSHQKRNCFLLGVIISSAALVLASCATSQNSSPPPYKGTPAPTADIPPSSACGTNGDYVTQSLNGDFTACFRVPDLNSSTLVASLQADFFGRSKSYHPPTTTITSPDAGNSVSLTLGSKTAKPGQLVSVFGHLKQPATKALKQSLPSLCWDGCEDGVQDQGIQLHWLSATLFRAKFKVPETAWLERKYGIVSVHPLISGSYQIGIECLFEISGCALRPAEASATLQLDAPTPTRCVSGRQCETMTLSSTRAQVGDKIIMKGWAPLESLIGRSAISYSISVAAGYPHRKYRNLSYVPLSENGGINIIVTPRVLHVVPGTTWADLGRISTVSSSWSGLSAITPKYNSNLVAWCLPTGLVVTGGVRQQSIPTSGVPAALHGTTLSISARIGSFPQCSTVLLDPKFVNSIYAGFDSAQGGSIPPVYTAPLYTTNDGASWHTVPIPKGMTIEAFGGFTVIGDHVLALFNDDVDENRQFPSGTRNGYSVAEVTSNGGATWSATTQGCPDAGPCMSFGANGVNYCNMSGSYQSLLLGPSGATQSSGIRWTNSSWVTSVNSCFSQQLVATSRHDLLLLDPSSQYSLLRSTTSGRTWSYVALPVVPNMNYAPDSAPLGNSFALASNGSLFAVMQVPATPREDLYRLYPSATSWCRVPGAIPALTRNATISPLRVDGNFLLWSQINYSNNGKETLSMRDVAIAKLIC